MATLFSALAWRIPWSLVAYSSWGPKGLDMTEQLTLSLSFLLDRIEGRQNSERKEKKDTG